MQRRLFNAGICLSTFFGFGSAIDRVEKNLALETGYRWDTITSSGALTDVAIIDNGTILADPVSGNPITRDLNNINIWQIGAHASVIFEHCFFIGIDLSYGKLFTNTREILSGPLSSSDGSFSTTFNHSIVQFDDKHNVSKAFLRLGPQIRLKGPAYIIPYAGFTYEQLTFNEDNSIRTHLLCVGASIRFAINQRFVMSAFSHYNFKGHRKEKIRLQVHDGIEFYLPAELVNGKVSGPTAQLKLDWLFTKRWRLGIAYTYRSFRSANATNAGFGGICGFKTTWRAESIDAGIRYCF